MTRIGTIAGCAAVALVAATLATGGMTTSAEPDVVVAPPADGAQLFHAKGCATCHLGPDSTDSMGIGPSLANAASWAAQREPGVSATDYLAESMLAPSTFISPAFRGEVGPMSGMPDLGLSPQEVDALIQYLLHP